MRRWCALSLDAIVRVSAQVDEAVALLDGHLLLDPTELETLVSSCESRVAELEQFYFDNDLDSRAIAFQKEGMRLRRALLGVPRSVAQAYKDSAADASTTSHNHHHRHNGNNSSNGSGNGNNNTTAADLSSFAANSGHPASTPAASRAAQMRTPAGDAGEGISPIRGGSVAVATAGDRSRHRAKKGSGRGNNNGHGNNHHGNRSVRPIYDWEVMAAEDAAAAAGGAEVRVKLTPAEFEELRRRRAEKKRAAQQQRRAVSSGARHGAGRGPSGSPDRSVLHRKEGGPPVDSRVPFLNSSSPFQDPSERARARDPRKPDRRRWVDPGKRDFVVSKKVEHTRADESLPLYLDAGVVYSSGAVSSPNKFMGDLRKGNTKVGQKGARHEKSFNLYSRPLGKGIDTAVNLGAEPVLASSHVPPKA